MFTFRNLVLWVHLSAIVLWIGGLLYQQLVMLPALRKAREKLPAAKSIAGTVSGRFQRMSLELVLIIILSGIFNIINAGLPHGFAFRSIYLPWLQS